MGYTPSLFWDSSLLEIYDLMDSYNRRKKNEMKELEEKLKAEISLNSVLARQIGEYVASLFNKEVQLTPLNNFFPSLFEEDEEDRGLPALRTLQVDVPVWSGYAEAFGGEL